MAKTHFQTPKESLKDYMKGADEFDSAGSLSLFASQKQVYFLTQAEGNYSCF